MEQIGRERAGAAVRDRIVALETTAREVGRKAGVSTGTLTALISGRRWPMTETRRRIEAALDWPEGEMLRIARGERPSLSAYSSEELLRELLDREARKC